MILGQDHYWSTRVTDAGGLRLGYGPQATGFEDAPTAEALEIGNPGIHMDRRRHDDHQFHRRARRLRPQCANQIADRGV